MLQKETGAKNALTKMSPTTTHRLLMTKPDNVRNRAVLLPSEVKKNLMDLMASDLIAIAKELKKPSITKLCLFLNHKDLRKKYRGSEAFRFLGVRHTDTVLTFCRALAWAISSGGCLQDLELGFCLCERDLKLLNASLCRATALKRLSFSNSELGDHKLQTLGKGLQECSTLEILDLSNCALTDAAIPLLGLILKANVCRKAQADWEGSLRNHNKRAPSPNRKSRALTALDLSYNKLSDATTQALCSVLHVGAPLEALNLRGNRLSRLSGKVLLEVMQELGALHLVDLRENLDNDLMCVLEESEHLTSFSKPHPPFWCDNSSTASANSQKKHPKKKLSGHEAKVKQCSRPRSAPSSELLTNSSNLSISDKGRRSNSRDDSVYKRHSSLSGKLQIQQLGGKKNSLFTGGSSSERSTGINSMGFSHSPTSRSDDLSKSLIQFHQSNSYCLSTAPDFHGWEHDDEADSVGVDLAMHMFNRNSAPAMLTDHVALGPDQEC